jgi:hypothetical protein
MVEQASCLSKFICPIMCRPGTSELTLNNRKTKAAKPFTLGHIPGCALCAFKPNWLPHMKVMNENNEQIGFIVARWFHNCQ